MDYTLNIGGELFQVDEENKVITKKELFETAYGSKGLTPQDFKNSKFLINHSLSDICFDKPAIKRQIKAAIQARIETLTNTKKTIVGRRLKNMGRQRVLTNLGDILTQLKNPKEPCPVPGESKAEQEARAAKAMKAKLDRIQAIVDTNTNTTDKRVTNIKGVFTTGGGKQSDLTDSDNYLQMVFKFMYVLAHPNKIHAKQDWTTLLDHLQDLSLEDILRGLHEQNESNSNNNNNNNNNNNSLLTDSQILCRLKGILQVLQTEHYLNTDLNLNEFSSANAKQNSSTFVQPLGLPLKSKLNKALNPLWRHYKAAYPSLYEFVESQDSMPLYSLLYLQTQMEQDTVKDKIIRLDETEFNTKTFKAFLKKFTHDYKSAKPETPLEQESCLLLEGRNFRIPDNLEESVETEIIDKLILKEGKRRHYKESLLRFLRDFFTKKSIYIVHTKRTEEELNGLSLNLKAMDLDSKLLEDVREQIPSLTLDRLGITVHQMPTDPVWTDSLNAFCAILAFKKELGSIPDGATGATDAKDGKSGAETE
jgi:hypothetical protein